MAISIRILVVCVLALSAGTAHAAAANFTIPHFMESGGTVADGPGNLDTQIEIAYPRGLVSGKLGAGTRLNLNLHLYNTSAAPLKSASGQTVCDPCGPWVLGGPSDPRKVSIRIDDLITAKGGFESTGGPVTGFAVLTVDGDFKNVAIQAFVASSISGPSQLSFLPLATVLTK